MKKKIGLGVLAVLVLAIGGVLIAAAMQPDVMRVERERKIAASADEIHPQLTDLRRWVEWNPWAERDPNMKITFSEQPSGQGAWYEWDGNDDVGKGKMTIAEVSPTAVRYRLEFIEPFASEADVELTLEPKNGRTTVLWTMQSDNDFMGKIFGVFMDMESMVGKDFEKGLANLEGVVTKG